MSDKGTVKFGIVGASYIAKTCMIKAINAQPDAKVVSLYSSDPVRGRKYAEETGIPRHYNSLAAFLADEDIQAVYVGSRNDQHKEQAIAAVRAGKHLLCEKPLALSVADAKEMVAAAAAAKVAFGVNHHIRSQSVNRKVRDLIRAGVIGKPLAARARFAIYLAEEYRGWRTENAAAGGGVALDLTVHVVDTLRFVLDDDVEEVVAMTANQGMAAKGIEDSVMGVLRFKSGVLAQIHDSFTIPHDVTGLQVHGTEGSLYAEDSMLQAPTGRIMLRKDGKLTEVPIGPFENHYEHLVGEFIKAVRGTGKPFCTGQDGLKSLAIAMAALESARTRSAVKLDV